MPKELAQLRRKAEACRRLADMSEDIDRKAMWLQRADYWELRAMQVQKHPRPRKLLRPVSESGGRI